MCLCVCVCVCVCVTKVVSFVREVVSLIVLVLTVVLFSEILVCARNLVNGVAQSGHGRRVSTCFTSDSLFVTVLRRISLVYVLMS